MKGSATLVIASAGSAALVFVMVWAVQPFGHAVMSTSLAFLAFEFGKEGARWFDAKEPGRE